MDENPANRVALSRLSLTPEPDRRFRLLEQVRRRLRTRHYYRDRDTGPPPLFGMAAYLTSSWSRRRLQALRSCGWQVRDSACIIALGRGVPPRLNGRALDRPTLLVGGPRLYDSLTQAFIAFLRDNGVVFASLAAVFAATTLVAVSRWMRARDQLRAAQDWLLQHSKDGERVDGRLQALEGAVDTLAIGVERLNETELFAAKLIAEKRAQAPAKAPDSYRVTTPH